MLVELCVAGKTFGKTEWRKLKNHLQRKRFEQEGMLHKNLLI
jgi:hypothetical protein